jgi:hypothetical protein
MGVIPRRSRSRSRYVLDRQRMPGNLEVLHGVSYSTRIAQYPPNLHVHIR